MDGKNLARFSIDNAPDASISINADISASKLEVAVDRKSLEFISGFAYQWSIFFERVGWKEDLASSQLQASLLTSRMEQLVKLEKRLRLDHSNETNLSQGSNDFSERDLLEVIHRMTEVSYNLQCCILAME